MDIKNNFLNYRIFLVVVFFVALLLPKDGFASSTLSNIEVEDLSAANGLHRGFGLLMTINDSKLIYFYREGSLHGFDVKSKIEKRVSLDNGRSWGKEEIVFDSSFDDRNLAGGVTSKGTIILFVSEYDGKNWRLVSIRSEDEGETWEPEQVIAQRNNTRSWYGKMVVLPDKLFQTFYDEDIRTIESVVSFDDGLTWQNGGIVFQGKAPPFCSETDFTFLGENKIIGISRDEVGQFIGVHKSSDAGSTWSTENIPLPSLAKVVPWIIFNSSDKTIYIFTCREGGISFRKIKEKDFWDNPALSFLSSTPIDIASSHGEDWGYLSAVMINKDWLVGVFYDGNLTSTALRQVDIFSDNVERKMMPQLNFFVNLIRSFVSLYWKIRL